MITSIHTLIYSDDAKATRAFFRDVLGWKCVAEDFDPGSSSNPDRGRWACTRLMCDDIEKTVSELRAKGAQFRGPVQHQIYGHAVMIIVPGADDIQLYQPTHKLAYNL
jgi:catechol 2,3-dioxygenase-like lactoylglutathione lyase family enzyme